MKIAFNKIGFNKKRVEVRYNSLNLEGELYRDNTRIVDFVGDLQGTISVECRRCGEPFTLNVNEPLNIKFSDGLYKGFEKEADIVEFYDGYVDFDDFLYSESESIKSEYYICPTCKNKEGENNGST